MLAALAIMPAFAAKAADIPVKAPPQEQATASDWTVTSDVEFRYFSWERTSGNTPGQPNQKGSQFYVPFGAAASGTIGNGFKLDLNARSGYVSTSRSADPGDTVYRSASVRTTTDSQLGFTLTYVNINGFVPFYSLNLNLPTGRSRLSGDEPIAATDPDLVDVPAFGVGFNHAHTLGANIPISPTMLLTLSAGYTNRGAYTREVVGLGLPVVASETYDPGDNFSLSAGLGTQFGSLALNGNVAVSWDQASKQGGIETSKTGTNLLLTGTAAYGWNDAHRTTLNLSYAHTERNYFQGPFGPPLVAEPFNSNSNIFSGNAEHAVLLSQVAQLFGKVGYLYRDANSYDPATLTFIPAKDKVSVGGGLRYGFSQNLVANARVERFWINERSYPGVPRPDQRFEGWVLALGATAKF